MEPTTLVVLGALGDLTKRLLLPGLGTLLAAQPHRQVRVWGVGRQQCTPQQWQQLVGDGLRAGGCPDHLAAQVADTSHYQRADVTDKSDLAELLASLPDRDHSVLYFALPPQVSLTVCELLADQHVSGQPLGGLRLALEKPFGTGLDSAQDLNRLLAGFRSEGQVFRVDHFLGLGQVLNLLGLRFANQLFEAVWNGQFVERVEITADETLALEGRAGYYDDAGALVDMHQSHLLLVLAVVAMEEPARIDAVELRDLMAHALRATRLAGSPGEASRRARYTAGAVEGRDIPGYADEDGVSAERGTETLAEIDVVVDNRRWAGVPFRLRSGKALARDCWRIALHFRAVAHIPEGLAGTAPPNRLTIDLDPERLELSIATNGAGDTSQLGETRLTARMGTSRLQPYGEILAGILDGDPLLSVRGDMAEECWRICAPVLRAWRADQVPLDEYAAGSAGPAGWPTWA